MSVNSDTDETPEGWVPATVGDILVVNYGKALKEENRKPGATPVYGSNGVVGRHDASFTRGPTIVIGRKGSVGEVHFSASVCWPIDTTYFIDDFSDLDSTFVFRLLQSLGLPELDTSSAIPGLNRDQLYGCEFFLPPLPEQKRVVVKVEALLARVSAARQRLAKVPSLLKRFRQSVLAAACSGQLTEDWRKSTETGSRATIFADVLDFVRRANEKRKSGKKETITQPEPPDELHELPAGWEWIPLGFLGQDPLNTVQTGPFGAQLHNDEFVDEGVPVIAVGNLTGMGFSTEGLYFITNDKAIALGRYDVQAGDLLFARSGATLGKVCVAPDFVKDWRMTGHILRGRLAGQFIHPSFAVFALWGDTAVLLQVSGNIRGITRPGFNTALLESIWLPVPPLAEQHEIVRRVEALLARADRIEKRLATATRRVETLTQAILAQAFRGELVPTEAELARQEGRDYESADVLLERIRTARSAEPAKKPGRARRPS